MTSICCTPPPDYKSLLPEEKQKFGFLVHQMRKKGFDLRTANEYAFYFRKSNHGKFIGYFCHHKKSTARQNRDYRYCRLEKDSF